MEGGQDNPIGEKESQEQAKESTVQPTKNQVSGSVA